MKGGGRVRLVSALLFVVLAGLAGGSTWLYVKRDLPPVDDLMQCRQYLNLVRATAREDEALPVLQSAQENLDRAQVSLDAQYRRLILFRNFDLVRYHIRRARELGGDALTTGRQARLAAVDECQRRLTTLRRSLRTTRALLARMSIKDGALVKLTSAEARLNVADSRLVDHESGEVREILNQAEEEIADASVSIQGNLEGFLTRRAQWNSWIQETISWSQRANDEAVLIDKLNHECYLLRGGRVIDSFPVDLGGEWMSQKIREGDRATPEGRYVVAALNRHSRFYMAAMLSYPNESDRSRFVRAKRQGLLPRSARIGGMIEIHGEGGRGLDWTAGCISLCNRDLERLFRYLHVGTPVTVVGLWQEPSWMQKIGAPAAANGAD
jgi:hypothetical protein